MKKINKNLLAQSVAESEGKKVSVNLAQIKEVIRCTLEVLSCYHHSQVLAMLEEIEDRQNAEIF